MRAPLRSAFRNPLRLLLLTGSVFAAAQLASAQTLVMDRFVMSGGGGTSSTGTLSLTGTIGQPDASVKLAGGSYGLESGFWSSVVAIQIPGAPLLSVLRIGSTVFISWPSDAAGYVLEWTGNLHPPANWVPVAGVANNALTTPAAPGTSFFRLRKP